MDAALIADAMRYRWLRDKAFMNDENCHERMAAFAEWLAVHHGADVDAMFDNEMSKQEAN